MNKEIRMLAAIMFTDMVGYTALMQENEKKAKKLRDKHRSVIEKYVSEHQGKILQYYGDGTLVLFGSCIEAAVCGMEIQKELQVEPIVPLRIGVHAGDVVYDDEGVYGDGVNVASRIENLAIPGSVLISEKVNDELRNHKDITSTEIGIYELKNVKYPVKLFAIDCEGIVVPTPQQITGKTLHNDYSIAVLPFTNMSADKDNEYFSDGITEEILNALAKVNGLMVTSRTSSFSFKGKNVDIRSIGKQLGVKNVLEGSVRKYGDQVRLTAQLINTENGYHKWSETYSRKMEDIFDLQDELSSTIVEQLKKTLTLERPYENLTKAPTYNMEAYNLYLQGMFFWNKWSPEHTQKALTYYHKAIEVEPEFALAYTGVSACNIFLGAVGVVSTKIAYPEAKKYATKALELDDTIPEAFVSMAMLKFFDEWDWSGAEKNFLKALELNPNSAMGHQYYGMLLTNLGYYKKAIKELELAHSLDPLNAPISSILAFSYFNSNMLKQAFDQYEKTKEIDPEFHESWSGSGWMYYHEGDIDNAIKTFEKVLEKTGYRHKSLSALGYLYAKTGDMQIAKDCIKELEEMESPDLPLEVERSAIYFGMGEMEKGFELLNSAFEKRLAGLNFIKCKYWKDIHSDPRYIDLLKKMNLPLD